MAGLVDESNTELRPSEIAHALHEGEKAEAIATIMRPAHDVYSFWRNANNLPLILKNLDHIEVLDSGRSRWFWRTKEGVDLAWESEIIAEIQDRMISWQSIPGSHIDHAGSVWFKPGADQASSEVHVQLRYHFADGNGTQGIAEFLGEDAHQLLHDALGRLRTLMEADSAPPEH